VHFGTSGAIDEARQQTLTAAYHANPARFGTGDSRLETIPEYRLMAV